MMINAALIALNPHQYTPVFHDGLSDGVRPRTATAVIDHVPRESVTVGVEVVVRSLGGGVTRSRAGGGLSLLHKGTTRRAFLLAAHLCAHDN